MLDAPWSTTGPDGRRRRPRPVARKPRHDGLREVYDALLKERNDKPGHQQIAAMLKRPGSASIAVGAGHLARRLDSVIAMLRAEGFEVTGPLAGPAPLTRDGRPNRIPQERIRRPNNRKTANSLKP